jgi:hypothetical protein
MRSLALAVLTCGVLAAAVGCGEDADPVALPGSGSVYRSLPAGDRLAVAESCRDRAAAAAEGDAARQLHDIDPEVLRGALDDAVAYVSERRHSVAELCAERLPFVTPGLRVSFTGAEPFGGDGFTYETTSDKPLEIRGSVAPVWRGGRIAVRREGERPVLARIEFDADGRFAVPPLKLRKQADNSFVVTINAPPSAPRKLYFSALCLDCLAGTGTPPAQQ